MGFRKNAAVAAARATYTDYAYIGCTRTDIKIATDLNDAGETLTDTTENMTDGETLTLRVEVSSERKVKYFMSITAATATALHVPTVSAEYQFDTGDTVIPSIRMLQHTDVCNVIMTYLKCGYLN